MYYPSPCQLWRCSDVVLTWPCHHDSPYQCQVVVSGCRVRLSWHTWPAPCQVVVWGCCCEVVVWGCRHTPDQRRVRLSCQVVVLGCRDTPDQRRVRLLCEVVVWGCCVRLSCEVVVWGCRVRLSWHTDQRRVRLSCEVVCEVVVWGCCVRLSCEVVVTHLTSAVSGCRVRLCVRLSCEVVVVRLSWHTWPAPCQVVVWGCVWGCCVRLSCEVVVTHLTSAVSGCCVRLLCEVVVWGCRVRLSSHTWPAPRQAVELLYPLRRQLGDEGDVVVADEHPLAQHVDVHRPHHARRRRVRLTRSTQATCTATPGSTMCRLHYKQTHVQYTTYAMCGV